MACNRLRLGYVVAPFGRPVKGRRLIWYADDASMATMRQVGALG